MKPAHEVWSKDDVPTPEVTMEEIILRAEKLRKKLRRANAMEYLAGAFVLAAFVAGAVGLSRLPTLSRIGAALIACATVFVLTYLALRGAAGEVRRDSSTLACYREELERRRALLASVVRWYLAPFWPGTALFFGGMAIEHRHEPAALATMVLSMLFAVAVNAGIAFVNARAARKLAAELALLPEP